MDPLKVQRMRRYKFKAIETPYWKPGDDYLRIIIRYLNGIVQDHDFVVLSEKAISIATGNIIDESMVSSGFMAHLIAKYWMRIIWGFFLGRLSNLKKETIQHLRRYPILEGNAHKQVALTNTGFLRALMYGSEGGIDGSNLPYSFVSLPLINPKAASEKIRKYVQFHLKKKVTIMIVDTDNTYSVGGFHFTHRVNPIPGIYSIGGFLAFVIGRFMKFKKGATPVAISGNDLSLENALEIADISNRIRGFGAGKNVWEMAERFGVSIGGVTWEMLETLSHKPIVIIRICD